MGVSRDGGVARQVNAHTAHDRSPDPFGQLEAALAEAAVPELERLSLTLFDALNEAADRAQDDERARAGAVQLLLYLWDRRQPSPAWSGIPTLEEQARARQWDLVDTLETLRSQGQTDVVPYRARSMALIGYALFGSRDDGPAMPRSAVRARPGPANVPLDLRGDQRTRIERPSSHSSRVFRFQPNV